MNRRTFLAGMAATTVGGLLALPKPAAALWECGPTQTPGVQVCQVGLYSPLANVTIDAVGGQRRLNCCWAACIEMVFRYYGYVVTQEDIVYQTWGRIEDMPADATTILRHLNGQWVDAHGQTFAVEGAASSATGDLTFAVKDLADDYPLIITTSGAQVGHAMVLSKLAYWIDSYNRWNVTEAVVRDPAPGVGRRALSAAEWNRRSMLARIRVYAL
jgi:hypothetical protein